MHAFLIDLDNKPGSLARVTEAIAAKGVNIIGASGITCGETGRAAFITSDESMTRTALGAIGCTYSEAEVVDTMLGHQPGTLAKACRRLADAKVNIEALMPLGMEGSDIRVGFITDNPVAARQALSHAGMATK